MIVTLVFDRKAVADLFAAGGNHVRVVSADQGVAMLRFQTIGRKHGAMRRTRGGGVALRLSGRSGALLVDQARFASGDRLRLESTSYKPVTASKAIPGQSTPRAASARICVTPGSLA